MNYHTVKSEIDEQIWQMIVDHAEQTFHTARGLEFSYAALSSFRVSCMDASTGPYLFAFL